MPYLMYGVMLWVGHCQPFLFRDVQAENLFDEPDAYPCEMFITGPGAKDEVLI